MIRNRNLSPRVRRFYGSRTPRQFQRATVSPRYLKVPQRNFNFLRNHSDRAAGMSSRPENRRNRLSEPILKPKRLWRTVSWTRNLNRKTAVCRAPLKLRISTALENVQARLDANGDRPDLHEDRERLGSFLLGTVNRT